MQLTVQDRRAQALVLVAPRSEILAIARFPVEAAKNGEDRGRMAISHAWLFLRRRTVRLAGEVLQYVRGNPCWRSSQAPRGAQ